MGICAAIECKIKVLEVYGNFTLVIYQLKGEWETRDPKLINYRELILDLIRVFDDITFYYLPRDENQIADALATLASFIRATENDKRTLRRLASDYFIDGEILYKRRKDQVLLRCVDANEAKKILEEVHEGVCKTHANGFTMARQIMRTSTGVIPYSLVYGMETVLPIEVEIPSLQVLSELKLDEAEWIQPGMIS
ncbi:uncharacterized protein [Gossypium hirsutum]|uniref:RNase H type-1 domain-containing protein n=1 Tax=Gossypium hirsutum TaxID=3635 RepID=A0ABM3C3X0_GOSHI|nr:uncharacterized protein LOC121232321 [Gossypium hirsutum]